MPPSTPAATRSAIAWLHRRAGFGLAPGALDAAVAAGLPATLDKLVDPGAHGVASNPDPWAGVALAKPTRVTDSNVAQAQTQAQKAIDAWSHHLAVTPRPLEDWMAWYWHGCLVSGLDKVVYPVYVVEQLRAYRSLGLGRFADLLKASTIEPAMLWYLDGAASTGASPNENHGREILELFSLGIGNYTEADVRAASRVLTGWTVRLGRVDATFDARRHDASPQALLGRSGVSNLDGLIDAITNHPACAPFVTRRLAEAMLGPGLPDDLIGDLAATFRSSGLVVRVLVRAILEAGLAGQGRELVLAPVPWLAAAERATGGRPAQFVRLLGLVNAGQYPFFPPDVSGWPDGSHWLSSSAVVARFNLAQAVADVAPASGAAMVAANARDAARLADVLGRPDGFSETTRAALAATPGVGREFLAVALASPDLMLA